MAGTAALLVVQRYLSAAHRISQYTAVVDEALGQAPVPGSPSRKAASRRPSAIDSSFPTGGASLKTRSLLSSSTDDGESVASASGPRIVAPPVIVGVAGASGSGKTCVAQLIEEQLAAGVRVVSISSDSYYLGLSPGAEASENNWDHPDALDLDLLASHLADLREGKDVHVPEYDFSKHQRNPDKASGTFISALETDVVIVDGIFVLAVEKLRATFDLTLFTVEELDVCLARRLRRDIAERGRSIESVLAQYLRFVRPGYINFIEPSKNKADILVPRARDNVVAIDMCAKEVRAREGWKGGGGRAIPSRACALATYCSHCAPHPPPLLSLPLLDCPPRAAQAGGGCCHCSSQGCWPCCCSP